MQKGPYFSIKGPAFLAQWWVRVADFAKGAPTTTVESVL
jgi:hypothetical protein